MYKMRIINNSQGNIFVLLIICSGVMALIAATMSGTISKYLDRQSQQNDRTQYNQMMMNIENLIQDPVKCRAMLGAGVNVVSAASTTTWQPIRARYFRTDNQPVLQLQAGVSIPEMGLTIKSVAVLFEGYETYTNSHGALTNRQVFYHYPAPTAVERGPYFKGKFRLRIVPTNFNFNEHITNREYDIEFLGKFRRQANGSPILRLYDCHGTRSLAQVCEISGGAYDVTYSPKEYRCNADLVCKNSDQGLINCASNCAAPFKKMFLAPDKCICQWCNANRPPEI